MTEDRSKIVDFFQLKDGLGLFAPGYVVNSAAVEVKNTLAHPEKSGTYGCYILYFEWQKFRYFGDR